MLALRVTAMPSGADASRATYIGLRTDQQDCYLVEEKSPHAPVAKQVRVGKAERCQGWDIDDQSAPDAPTIMSSCHWYWTKRSHKSRRSFGPLFECKRSRVDHEVIRVSRGFEPCTIFRPTM